MTSNESPGVLARWFLMNRRIVRITVVGRLVGVHSATDTLAQAIAVACHRHAHPFSPVGCCESTEHIGRRRHCSPIPASPASLGMNGATSGLRIGCRRWRQQRQP